MRLTDDGWHGSYAPPGGNAGQRPNRPHGAGAYAHPSVRARRFMPKAPPMTGKLAVIMILLASLAAGIGVYYTQVYAFYDEVPEAQATVQLTPFEADPEVILAENIQAIDADSSPIRYRACFTTPMSHALLSETSQGDDRGELIRFRAQKGKRKKSFTSFAEGGLRLDEPLHQRQMINWEIDHDCYTDDDEMKKGKYSL